MAKSFFLLTKAFMFTQYVTDSMTFAHAVGFTLVIIHTMHNPY